MTDDRWSTTAAGHALIDWIGHQWHNEGTITRKVAEEIRAAVSKIEDEARVLDAEPVIKAAFAVVEDMRLGLNKSHPKAAQHLAAYDAAIEARRKGS